MKRDLKPFVVEVKRGKRRSQLGKPFESLGLDSSLGEAAKRAEMALFASPPAQKIVAAPPPQTAGRVLPSLIEIPPVVTRDAEPAPRRRGRKPGSKNKPKLANGDHPSAIEAPRSRQPKVPAATSPIVTARSFGTAGTRPPSSASIKTEAARPIVIEPATVETHAPAGPTPRSIRLRNRSSILARYVLGTEPAPGEQWKRRSRRKAADDGKARVPR